MIGVAAGVTVAATKQRARSAGTSTPATMRSAPAAGAGGTSRKTRHGIVPVVRHTVPDRPAHPAAGRSVRQAGRTGLAQLAAARGSLPSMDSGAVMGADEFKEAQQKLGLTNEQTSRLLRVSVRTIEKWRQGTREVPGPAIVVLKLCQRYKSAVAWLLVET